MQNSFTSWILIALLFASACKTKGPGPALSDRPNNPQASKDMALWLAGDLVLRPPIQAIELDNPDFQVTGLRVGEETFLNYSTPVLIFQMPGPNLADYVEVIRCPANVIINGGYDMLNYLDLGASNPATTAQMYARNDFWKAALNTSGCLLVTSSYTDVSFEDTNCPTGSYFYMVRSCAEPSRIQGADAFGKRNCSLQLGISPTNNHVNRRTQSDLAALQKAAQLRSSIDTLGRQISTLTSTLAQQLLTCQQQQNAAISSNAQKTSIKNILSATVGAAIPAVGAAAVGYLATRRTAEPTVEGTRVKTQAAIKTVQKSLSARASAAELKTQVDTLRTSVEQHTTMVNQEIDTLTAEAEASTSSTTRGVLQEQIKNYQDEEKQLNTQMQNVQNAVSNGGSSIDPQALNTMIQAMKRPSAALSNVARILTYTGLGASAAYVVGNVYGAASQPVTPVNPKTCPDVLATQTDLQTLGANLQQYLELYQTQVEGSGS